MESARIAGPADLDRLVELATAAIAELSLQRGGAVWRRREARAEPVGPGLAAAMADGDQRVLAGCIDDQVVGYAVAHLEPLRDGALLGVVDDLYVEPGARDVSVGEAMMDDLLAWCEERGCMGVDSLALPGTRQTKNFFERYGLVARAIVVHRSLAEPSAESGNESGPESGPDSSPDSSPDSGPDSRPETSPKSSPAERQHGPGPDQEVGEPV